MNMSKCISSIIMQLGLYGVALPFTDTITGDPIPTENVIRDVLTTTTIPLYSEFVPWVRKGDIDIRSLKIVDKKDHIYLLPAILTITPIKYVMDVRMPYTNVRETYGDISPSYGINRSVQGVITSQTYMMLAGQMRSEPTFEYLGHNQIKLYGYPNTTLTFAVACEHMANGESIEDSCYDSFMELSILNVKTFLYNNLKYFDDQPTAFGSIKLKIESFESAEGELNQTLDRWRDTFHLDIDYSMFM